MKLSAIGAVVLATRVASADAVVTLRKGPWDDYGWRKGTPILSIGGARLVGKTTVKASVSSAKELVRAEVTVDGQDGVSFLVALRDRHHYTISPDPCCLLTVDDADDGLASRARCGGNDR